MQQIELPGLALAEPQVLRATPSTSSQRFDVARDPLIDMALAGHAPVYVGVSGGKDSQALAYRVQAYLETIGHRGPRALIHSDLGRIEWRDSAPVCERLAERLGWELVTVRRPAGDMVDRWLSRWAANVERYRTLSCVKLIMPWSSAAQRFCTSELKTQIIARAIRARHPVGPVVSVIGLRWEESPARARQPVAKRDMALSRARGIGLAWNAIIHWPRQDMLDYIRQCGGVLHEAYTSMAAAGCPVPSACWLRAATCMRRHAATTTPPSTANWSAWRYAAPSRSNRATGSGTWLPACWIPRCGRDWQRPRSARHCAKRLKRTSPPTCSIRLAGPCACRPRLKRAILPRCAGALRRPWASSPTVWMPMPSLPGTRN